MKRILATAPLGESLRDGSATERVREKEKECGCER